MNWATLAIKKLKKGESIKVRPHGNSMRGKINSGALVTLKPCEPRELEVDDIVLVRVKGNVYLHLIKAKVNNNGNVQFLIGNNLGKINGWVNDSSIYGVVTEIKN